RGCAARRAPHARSHGRQWWEAGRSRVLLDRMWTLYTSMSGRTRQPASSGAEESLQRGAAAVQGCATQDAVVVGSFEEVLAVFSADTPGVVVHVEVAEPAEEHAVVDVGAPVVGFPVVDVVGLCPGGR